MNRTDVVTHLDELIQAIQDHAASRSYSVTLDRFVIPDVTANTRTEVLLHFDMLVVNRGIGTFVVELVDLRNFILSGELTRRWVVRLPKGNLDARRLELNTNVSEQFGDGFMGTLIVAVSVQYGQP